MPDISMCPSPDCPVRADCYRNEASGTKPSEGRQSWAGWTWRATDEGAFAVCDGFWPVRSLTHPDREGKGGERP